MSIYLLDKEAGITSNKALSFVKNELNVKKAGFSGVLDPFATGLLIIATEGDTKFLDLFLNSSKTYSGIILFGSTTNTLDTKGEVVEKVENVNIDIYELRNIINEKFIGKINQTPPKFSNIKVNGKRAHELSRKDIEFELKPVEREIFSFDIEKISDNEVKFNAEVSSGTYIRSLARDLGSEINVPSMLTSLRRESIGNVNAPNELTKVSREDIIPLSFLEVESNLITDLLNGKEVQLSIDDKELVVKDKERYLWVRKKDNGSYKIHKNIK